MPELIKTCEGAQAALAASIDKVKASGDASAFSQEAKEMAHVYYTFLMANKLRDDVPASYARVGFVSKDVYAASSTLEAVLSRLRTQNGKTSWSLPKQGAHFRSSGVVTSGKVAALFSGQGSQYTYMFDDVAMNWPPMRTAISQMDAISAKTRPHGTSLVSDTLYPRQHYESEPAPDHDKVLQDTLHAQPCTTAVAVGAYDVFSQAGFTPDFTAGHSLGEIAALYASGMIERADAFELVCHRATAMSEMSKTSKGEAMAAVVGPNASAIKISSPNVWLANINEPSQVVISGTQDSVASESDRLSKAGFRVVPLKVSGAFHTPLMQEAGTKFESSVRRVAFKPSKARVYSNVTGGPAYDGDATASANLLSKHITSSVRWVEQIQAMHRDGARVFVEFGPRATLTKFVEKIVPGDDVCVVCVNPSKDKCSDTQLREAAVQLAVFGVPISDFDPWQVRNPLLYGSNPALPPPKKSKGKLKLTAATFVAPRTLRARDTAMADGYKLSGNVMANVVPSDGDIKAKDREIEKLKREAAEAKKAVEELSKKLLAAESSAEEAKAEAHKASNKLAFSVQATPALSTGSAPKDAAPTALAAPTTCVSADHATKVVIDVLAAKTGYEPEMIEMDMNLETELGVDSIKRVEILSEVQKELNVEAQNVAALSRTQTVGEVVDAMIKELGTATLPAPQSAPSPPSERATDSYSLPARHVAVGTVKSNVGHTGYASGAAALIKTALCLHNRYLPKMPKWNRPKAHMRDVWEDSPLYTCPSSRAWVVNHSGTRYAAVSGVSCTAPDSKFHVHNVVSTDKAAPKLITLRADSHEGIKQAISAARSKLSRGPADATFASLLLDSVKEERDHRRSQYALCLVATASQLAKELDLAATGVPTAIASGRDYTSPSGSFFSPQPMRSSKVAFMYGDGSSPYFGLGQGIHRVAPSLHDFVQQSTTSMWSMKHDTWNPRAVTAQGVEAESIDFEKHTVDMFRSGVYHSVCFTHIARELLKIEPRAAFGLSLGEASMFFAFDKSNSLKSDEMLARLDSSAVWTQELSQRFEALRTAWGVPADAPLSSFWVGYAVQKSRDEVLNALRQMGAAASCVRLVIVNDANTCFVAGKPSQCDALIARLGCSALRFDQGLCGHCKEVEPFREEIARIHESITFPKGEAAAGVSFYSMSTGEVKKINPSSGSMGTSMGSLYSVLADFPELVSTVSRDGHNVFVELGAGDMRASATKNILGASGVPHVAVAIDRKGADHWRQVLKLAATLISHGETGCEVHRLYHPEMIAELEALVQAPAVKNKLRKSVQINGRFTGMSNAPAILKSYSKPDSRLLALMKRVPTSAMDLGDLEVPPAQGSAGKLTGSGSGFGSKGSMLEREIEYQRAQARKYKATGKPLLWDFDDLLQYAEGDIAPVFNKHLSGEHPPWEVIDTYAKCCRLPQREYLLCSRVTKMSATTNKYEPCSMSTEYDLPYDGELSEGGQIPWAVLVESGQCDLMLISYLGIDFQNKGVRAYRLLDTTLTFFGVAQEGQTLCYDISIQSFAKQEGQVTMFFFSYDCYVDGKLLIEMRNGVAGFFTKAELDAGKGVVWTDGERSMRKKAMQNKKDPTPFLLKPASKTSFSETDMQLLSEKGHHEGTWGEVLGPTAASVTYKLCARKMLMIDRVTHIMPRGGIYGLGMLIGEKLLERDHWYFPCHFKNDQVMAGSLVSDGCSQLLKLYMIWMGLHTCVDGITFTPVHNQPNKVRCRGQISPHKGKLVYWVEIKDMGFDSTTGYPYAKADVNILDIDFEKGETFDHPDDASLLAALEEYGKGNMKRKIVVDFRGVALQMEGPPTASHPTKGTGTILKAPAPTPVISGYDVGGLHLSGGFRSELPPKQFMKWGGPTVGGHKLTWHPLAGRNGNPMPGFRATSYPPRPICFLPFPGNPNDTNHTPGQLPLSWVNMCEFMCNDLSACLGEEYKGFDESTSSRSPAYDLALTTRVLSVTGMVQEKGSTKWYGVDCDPSTGTMVAEFDCPADAWFFAGAPRDDLMPYAAPPRSCLWPPIASRYN
ncbi:MAG: hypothetical protein SGPRY_005332 [Prymnesium sp.]